MIYIMYLSVVPKSQACFLTIKNLSHGLSSTYGANLDHVLGFVGLLMLKCMFSCNVKISIIINMHRQ